jgi:hypothetical protein
VNDHISKCGISGLRAAAGIFVALGLGGTALGQNTALTINGQTATNNLTTVNATAGSTLTVKIDNTGQVNRLYGLFCALAHNANSNSGWYLDVSGGKKPFPVATGVATSVVEANYPPVDIVPDRPFNPNFKLDAGGHLTLSFLVPIGIVGTYYFQAVVLKTGSTTQTDLSNAVAVTFGAPTTAARIACSVATAGNPQVDHAQFGILEFTNGTPSSGVFTGDPVLLDIKVDAIAMGDMHPWALHSVNGTGAVNSRRPRDFDWQSAKMPALNVDNYDYGRVELPPLAGADGILGTPDDIPARSIMRCFDNVSSEGFFLIVNKGPNPNSPGVDFYVIGRKKDSLSASTNSWKIVTAFSPDGSRMSAIYDDGGTLGAAPQMFLIATDCSKPFQDSLGNATDIVDVSPGGLVTKNFYVKGQIFTDNRLWFTRDTGQNVDLGGGSDIDRELWTVNARATQPSPTQVSIPVSPNYTNAQVDQIPDKAFVVARNGGTTMCFVAGNVFVASTVGTPTVPDLVQSGDWYAVTELKPTSAVNLTTFPSLSPQVNVYVAGDAYNGQSGYASLSPDGSKLAIAVQHGNETAGTEEVYIYSTKDSNNDGVGDDAGLSHFNNPISSQSNFDHTLTNQGLKKACDLYLADNDHLQFFYGSWTSAATKEMDLFSWNDSTKVIANLTATTGAITFPIKKKGNIYPEGYFISPNGRYQIFSRGSSTLSKTNLVAAEIATSKLLNITGDEFAGAKTSITSNPGPVGENFDWHLSFAGGAYPSLCFFGAPIDGASGSPRNPWVFDANFPTTAIQLTNDSTPSQLVDALTPSPVTLGCAWSWGANTQVADLEYQDLLYYFRDDLTETPKLGAMSLGNIFWLRAGTAGDTTGASPPALIAVFGDDSNVADIDNPHDGKSYYFSLNGTTNYKFTNTTGVDAPGHQIGTTSGVICIYAVQKP